MPIAGGKSSSFPAAAIRTSPRSRGITIPLKHTLVKSHTSRNRVHRAAWNELDVSILSLFKCVCRIILTSRTQAKIARVRAHTLAGSTRTAPFSLSPSALSPFLRPCRFPSFSPPLTSSPLSRPSRPPHRRCRCTRKKAHARAREEEPRGPRRVNQIAVCARQTTRRVATPSFPRCHRGM